ncbi:MAG TPA: HAMP domain-containing sensor histidine kinase [Methylococcaceae bacterium]|nr:HAMP domain-containing sensor histidine kinase [Methylococcaceae bacterium]
MLLPYSAIDFDDQNKVRNAVEMAACLVRSKRSGSLCVAIGNNPWTGGFIYAAGTFASGPLEVHQIGDEYLDGAHRLRVTASLRGQTYRLLAPFERPEEHGGGTPLEGVRGRFTGYLERDGRNYKGARPVKEFRGWVWQNGTCLNEDEGADPCEKVSFFSLRLPVEVLRDALFQRARPQWPPPDLDQFRVRVEVLPPGDGAALFDSHQPGAAPPFSLDSLAGLLLPGESLSIRRVGGKPGEHVNLAGHKPESEPSARWIDRLIRKLPVENLEAPTLELVDEVATQSGTYHLLLRGDARSVNKTLSAVATRVSWFVAAMLGAIALAWLVIEIGIVRRIATLSRRTQGLSQTVHGDSGLERYDIADLRGGDELGLLATGLNDLLRRVREDAEREKIRAEQEKDLWHAVGHEIVSRLQSLLALHGSADDPSRRYIQRMHQAIRILYGSASPSEAFQSSSLNPRALDIAGFLDNVAANAGIADVHCTNGAEPTWVRADEHSLEDVFSHLLKNADRYRIPGTPITLSLDTSETAATVTVHNVGPRVAADFVGKIFEYGVSDQAESGAAGNRGQGLFVAKTYMAKMGGTICVCNEAEGVSFRLGFQRLAG